MCFLEDLENPEILSKFVTEILSESLKNPEKFLENEAKSEIFSIEILFSGFSLTFEVEGHCYVSRQVPSKKLAETSRGIRIHGPLGNF